MGATFQLLRLKPGSNIWWLCHLGKVPSHFVLNFINRKMRVTRLCNPGWGHACKALAFVNEKTYVWISRTQTKLSIVAHISNLSVSMVRWGGRQRQRQENPQKLICWLWAVQQTMQKESLCQAGQNKMIGSSCSQTSTHIMVCICAHTHECIHLKAHTMYHSHRGCISCITKDIKCYSVRKFVSWVSHIFFAQ